MSLIPKDARVAIFVNHAKPFSETVCQAVVRVLTRREIHYEIIPTKPADSLDRDLAFRNFTIAICIGGDGTMLQAAHRFNHFAPIIGLNAGHLGFLTAFDFKINSKDGKSPKMSADIRRALADVRRATTQMCEEEFIQSKRLTLEVVIQNGQNISRGWAVNDVVVSRGSNLHLLHIGLSVGGSIATTYRCDGLIISSPNGSTAYNLAAGGPIINPENRSISITPICPQALSNRSLVVNDTESIELSLRDGPGTLCDDGIVYCDSIEVGRLTKKSTVHVGASAYSLTMCYPKNWNYYAHLGKKLGWTGDGIK